MKERNKDEKSGPKYIGKSLDPLFATCEYFETFFDDIINMVYSNLEKSNDLYYCEQETIFKICINLLKYIINKRIHQASA